MGEKANLSNSQFNKFEKTIANIQDTVKTYKNKVIEVEKTVKEMPSNKEFARQIMRNLAN